MFQWTARAFAFTRKRPVGFVAMSSVRIKSSQAQPHITHLWVFNSLCHLHKEWGCPLHGASNKMSAVPTITSELSDFSVFNNLAPGPVWYLCLFVTIANTFPGALMEQQARQATAWGPKPVGRGPPRTWRTLNYSSSNVQNFPWQWWRPDHLGHTWICWLLLILFRSNFNRVGFWIWRA